MVAMVFMILYLIAVVAMFCVFMLAWHEEPGGLSTFGAVTLAIICGIAWPIILIGVFVYAIKCGLLEEEEES